MKKAIFLLVAMASVLAAFGAGCGDTLVIDVKTPRSGAATAAFDRALDRARRAGGRPVLLRLTPGAEYRLTREAAHPRLYHVSNTTSKEENADPTKHVGILMRGLSNLTVDGRGARFVTEGELTPWVIDSCRNVELRGFSIDAADPSVPEMTVAERTDSSFTARVNSRSDYRVDADGVLYWRGHGWEFKHGIAQMYFPQKGISVRVGSPMTDARRVVEREPGLLEFVYGGAVPSEAEPGNVYQMRHSFRTEVAGLITGSSDIVLSDINFHFMGNFGVVAQMSENLTYRRLVCAPDPASGRTDAGFADFFQVSGCSGLVSFADCVFAGSHDDPINVHGTHLRVVGSDAVDRLTVRYMHPQTFGFQSFTAGDTVQLTDPMTLLPLDTAVVVSASMVNDYDIALTLDRSLRSEALTTADAVVENLTRCPAVDIRRCSFTLTPARGVLVTTWRPVRIIGNTFVRCPHAAVLIADDARSWYESGAVRDVVIADNEFVDCASPVISIAPECVDGTVGVHSGIIIEGNRFITDRATFGSSQPEVFARSVSGLRLSGNHVKTPSGKGSLRLVAEGSSVISE